MEVTIRHTSWHKDLPAINVKCLCQFGPALTEVMKKFSCTAKVADRAFQWAWNAATREFWIQAQEMVDTIFGKNAVEMHQDGRSGGWLVIEGLPDVDTWTEGEKNRWFRFEEEIRNEIKRLCQKTYVMESIESNRWAEENAEEYNFYENKDGTTICLADVPRCLHCKNRR